MFINQIFFFGALLCFPCQLVLDNVFKLVEPVDNEVIFTLSMVSFSPIEVWLYFMVLCFRWDHFMLLLGFFLLPGSFPGFTACNSPILWLYYPAAHLNMVSDF